MKKIRQVDTSKKSNIKCEHCKYWKDEYPFSFDFFRICNKHNAPKHYYQRCRQFEWRENILESNKEDI